ncbi:nuclear GTPase SLIP-GC-like [Mugil cephalus]|uniref:nuclear GTPase SLIP-GC-like n=1 Tax=Mugil cephalus TaxID=48193 RepID=UPI001FB5E4E4|nr:nuclear GTPase SLIP-GC-like [Mugil cephalus]
MDDFVCTKLNEWGLKEWIDTFKEQGIDKETLFYLEDQEIRDLIPKVGPRAKFKRELKLLKVMFCAMTRCKYLQLERDEAADSPQTLSYTSGDTINTQPETCLLHNRKKIDDLETDKRELVGVFGKTGAGKSSLINAIIGERDLLLTGSINACTTVMIKVEANMHNSKYEAEIEFIPEEEWEDELWPSHQFHVDDGDQEDRDDYNVTDDDIDEKLSALYGEEWNQKTPKELMDKKYFKEIPEFLKSATKTLTGESAKELSAKFTKYTRSDPNQGEGKDLRRFYWPLVKCVTVRVPQNKFLQHVTLVDLPGNGDCNKSRDKMWKEVIVNCSTVWIVTDINRAAAETEPWEILENASSSIGNGGECQHIHFICTKSDQIDDNGSADEVYASILKRNMKAKEAVNSEFKKRSRIMKHFSSDCFKVFTVSSKEFLKENKPLKLEDTEIPKLKEFLKNLNDSHSETLNYVSGAYGILSLIQGARCREGTSRKTEVCEDLKKTLNLQVDKVKKVVEDANKAFEMCLDKGVEMSKRCCEQKLEAILSPRKRSSGFHRTLKSVVKNNGIHKPRRGRQINLNMTLTSFLTDSIDEKFRKTFPNDGNTGPFGGFIREFSLNTDKLIQQDKDVELLLRFLKTEEENMKTKVIKYIRDKKKIIYSSLIETTEKNMRATYQRAFNFRGKDTLKNMRTTVMRHVYDSKNNMFEEAKNVMLGQLNELKEHVLETLEKTMKESIELSLTTGDCLIPDVSDKLAMVKKLHDALTGDLHEEK